MDKIRVGQIVNTQGLKGEVRVYPYVDYKERFAELDFVYMGESDQKVKIQHVKYKSNLAILKLEGYDDINVVEKLKGTFIYIGRDQTRDLPDDTYLVIDLIGIKAYLEDGTYLGEVKEVMKTGANDVYVIQSEDKEEYLIPAMKMFVPHLSLEEKKMIVTPIEGMI